MPTLKEAPSDAVAESHKLMIRGGYIRQVTAGVYAYLPLGYRVLRKAEGIIEQEMDKINVPEMIMPHLLSCNFVARKWPLQEIWCRNVQVKRSSWT